MRLSKAFQRIKRQVMRGVDSIRRTRDSGGRFNRGDLFRVFDHDLGLKSARR